MQHPRVGRETLRHHGPDPATKGAQSPKQPLASHLLALGLETPGRHSHIIARMASARPSCSAVRCVRRTACLVVPRVGLARRVCPSLVSRLLAVTGSRAEAEDVVQDAFTKALVSWRESWPQKPEGWLLTVAVNTARSRWRRARRGEVITRVAHTTHVDLPGLSPDRVALLAALRRLPAAQREAIALHHVADLPVEEVAAIVVAPTGTVKARLSRGRAALALLLDERVDDPSFVTRTPSTEVHPRHA